MQSASSTPPAGIVAAPENATTPKSSKSTPGVAIPCSTSSAAMTANAEPIITLRPSFRRAAATVSTIAATVAAPALAPTKSACATPPQATCSDEEVQERGRENREADARSEDWLPGQLPQHDL